MKKSECFLALNLVVWAPHHKNANLGKLRILYSVKLSVVYDMEFFFCIFGHEI